jgi:hypothetical protein
VTVTVPSVTSCCPRTARRARAECPAFVVLPIAGTALSLTGALAAVTHGAITPTALIVLTAVVVLGTASIGDRPSVVLVMPAAYFTAIGFTRPPYAELRGGPQAWRAAVIIAACAAGGLVLGHLVRRVTVSRPAVPAVRVPHPRSPSTGVAAITAPAVRSTRAGLRDRGARP